MTLCGRTIAVRLAQRVEVGAGGGAAICGVTKLMDVETVFAFFSEREMDNGQRFLGENNQTHQQVLTLS